MTNSSSASRTCTRAIKNPPRHGLRPPGRLLFSEAGGWFPRSRNLGPCLLFAVHLQVGDCFFAFLQLDIASDVRYRLPTSCATSAGGFAAQALLESSSSKRINHWGNSLVRCFDKSYKAKDYLRKHLKACHLSLVLHPTIFLFSISNVVLCESCFSDRNSLVLHLNVSHELNIGNEYFKFPSFENFQQFMNAIEDARFVNRKGGARRADSQVVFLCLQSLKGIVSRRKRAIGQSVLFDR